MSKWFWFCLVSSRRKMLSDAPSVFFSQLQRPQQVTFYFMSCRGWFLGVNQISGDASSRGQRTVSDALPTTHAGRGRGPTGTGLQRDWMSETQVGQLEELLWLTLCAMTLTTWIEGIRGKLKATKFRWNTVKVPPLAAVCIVVIVHEMLSLAMNGWIL